MNLEVSSNSILQNPVVQDRS